MLTYLRVNMSTCRIHNLPLPPDLYMLGGRGIVSKILYSDMDPAAHPGDPNSIFVICCGLLADAAIPAHQLVLGVKSSSSGLLASIVLSNCLGYTLASQGIRAVVVEGRAVGKRNLLLISPKCIELRPYTLASKERLEQDLEQEFGLSPAVLLAGDTNTLSVKEPDRDEKNQYSDLGQHFIFKGLAGIALIGDVPHCKTTCHDIFLNETYTTEIDAETKAAWECMGMSVPAMPFQELVSTAMERRYGGQWTPDKIRQIGKDTLQRERAFNDWSALEPGEFTESSKTGIRSASYF